MNNFAAVSTLRPTFASRSVTTPLIGAGMAIDGFFRQCEAEIRKRFGGRRSTADRRRRLLLRSFRCIAHRGGSRDLAPYDEIGHNRARTDETTSHEQDHGPTQWLLYAFVHLSSPRANSRDVRGELRAFSQSD